MISNLSRFSHQDGDLWVLLVAGSNGWFNYRHQADICHAYQIVHAHGVPDDRIIVMMYDDIAYNKENPTPGMIINQVNIYCYSSPSLLSTVCSPMGRMCTTAS